jgi:hypothetical protein
MNIKVLGINDNSSEYKSALCLKDIFSESFKQLKGNIYIKPNLTLLGNNAEQLDLLVWGNFEGGYKTPYNLSVFPKDPNNNYQSISDKIQVKVSFDNFF